MENEAHKLTLPCITINGTSPARLLEDYSIVRKDILLAVNSMQTMEFHSRDYMQQENGAEKWRQAQKEHASRMQRLIAVADEIFTIMEHVNQFVKE